jgi:hypothetical protein
MAGTIDEEFNTEYSSSRLNRNKTIEEMEKTAVML